jgi:hypothetical protein
VYRKLNGTQMKYLVMIILRKNEDIRYFHIKLIHIHGRKLKMRKLYKNQANKIKRMENTEVDVNPVNRDVLKNT